MGEKKRQNISEISLVAIVARTLPESGSCDVVPEREERGGQVPSSVSRSTLASLMHKVQYSHISSEKSISIQEDNKRKRYPG